MLKIDNKKKLFELSNFSEARCKITDDTLTKVIEI